VDDVRILIADDEPVSRLLLKRVVEQNEHECIVATNGVEAWERLQADRVDVVITDWLMPEMDGPELCARIRSLPGESYTYVILLTSLGDREHFLEGMQAGADDHLAKPLDSAQLRARLLAAERVLSLHGRLAQQNAALAALNQALAESARTDPLTGLGNRLRMWEDLRVTHSQLERYGARYAVALCDIDHFKAFNDRYGHLAGDEALRLVAQLIAEQCRGSDRAYRYGGEEFLILLPGQDEAGATTALNRIREAVQEHRIPHASSSVADVVTISGGVVAAEPGSSSSPEEVVGRADEALYQAKAAGRNRVIVYQPSGSSTF
jgi:diguanylate cyclase (GGDEF)-like protein